MFGWGKKTQHPSSATSDSHQAIRTMADDLTGAPFPDNTEALPPEPPVNFVPDPGKGAPFFSAEPSVSPADQTASPFLSKTGEAPSALPVMGTAASEGAGEGAPQTYDALQSDPSLPTSNADRSAVTTSPMRRKLVLFGSLGLGALLLLGGGLYFFMRSSGNTELAPTATTPPTSPDPAVPAVPPTVPIDIPGLPLTTKYSSARPNFLYINTETITAESLRTLLLRTATEVKDEKLTGAVEFLVRDQNYNPLAFSRFSYLAKIDLPEALLTQVDEPFSLFVVVDADRPRLGLSLKVRTPETFSKELVTAEKSLVQAINPIFVDTTTAPKGNAVFRSGSYNGLPTRFANVDEAINLSVDYALRGNEWMIGTSKNTLRAIVDKTAASAGAPAVGTAPVQ